MNVFEAIENEKVLGKNPGVLLSSFPPENKFPHRDQELRQLVMSLQPLLAGQKAGHVFLFGAPGTGKTAITKYVVESLREQFDSRGVPFEGVYVDCDQFKKNTKVFQKIVADICEKHFMNGEFKIKRTVAGYQLMNLVDTLKNILRVGVVKNLVIVLDEIDVLLNSKDQGDYVIRTLSRLKDEKDIDEKVNIVIVIISNSSKVREMIRESVWSGFSPTRIDFQQYNAPQLTNILLDRAAYAFNDGELEDGALQKISAVECSLRRGDARMALETLYESYKISSAQGFVKITVDVVNEAIERTETNIFSRSVELLNKHQRILLLAILQELQRFPTEKLTSVKSFKRYSLICAALGETGHEVSERQLQNILKNDFEKLSIVDLERSWYSPEKKSVNIISFSHSKNTLHKTLDSLYKEFNFSEEEFK